MSLNGTAGERFVLYVTGRLDFCREKGTGNISGVIRLTLKELLKERGQTLYWLRNQTGIRYATLLNMRDGKAARVDLSALETLCRALECEPGELLVLKPKLKAKTKH